MMPVSRHRFYIGEFTMGITIGIDLGTTNSVACLKKINVSTILNAEGEELTPSSSLRLR